MKQHLQQYCSSLKNLRIRAFMFNKREQVMVNSIIINLLTFQI
nr:MAG TPA: hypothetical protein [Caudoviricetes sp.]